MDDGDHCGFTSEEYADTLQVVGLTKKDGSPDHEMVALFFGAHEATGYKWAQNGPPPAVVIGLRMMLAQGLTARTVQRRLGRQWPLPFRAKDRRPGRPRRAA